MTPNNHMASSSRARDPDTAPSRESHYCQGALFHQHLTVVIEISHLADRSLYYMTFYSLKDPFNMYFEILRYD